MDTRFWILGIMKIRRGPAASDPYTIEELGTPAVQLTGPSEVDLIPYYGGSWEAVKNLCYNLPNVKLYQDISDGVIVITEETPPRKKIELDE